MITFNFSLSDTFFFPKSTQLFHSLSTIGTWWKKPQSVMERRKKKKKKTPGSREVRVLFFHLLEVGYFGSCIGIQFDLRWAHLLGLLFGGETKHPACPQSKANMQDMDMYMQAKASAGSWRWKGSVTSGLQTQSSEQSTVLVQKSCRK